MLIKSKEIDQHISTSIDSYWNEHNFDVLIFRYADVLIKSEFYDQHIFFMSTLAHQKKAIGMDMDF